MSEEQTRPVAPRGRGSGRGGRGAFSSRGGRGGRAGHATNGDKTENPPVESIDDDGEVAQLKKKYGSKVDTIKEVFPDWTDEDAVMALEETDGDLDLTLNQISTGAITQWGEVSKNKKDKSKSKSKEATTASPLTDLANARTSRGGRGGFEGSRGGRGRGIDRGRGGGRGGRGASVAHTNGTRTKETALVAAATSSDEATAWETAKPADTDAKPAGEDSWSAPSAQATEPESSTASSIIPEGVKRSWASIFKTAPPPPPEPKKAPVPVEKPVEEIKPAEPIVAPEPAPVEEEPVSEPIVEPKVEITPIATPVYEPEPNITPSKDELTETNLEQVLDTSNPAPTATAASTAASSWDPHSAGASNNYSALQQQSRTPASGYAATALKATGAGGRSASFQRRVLDQEEAVRMPGNREVDRTTVQFGAFNLSASGDEDIDGDREEPETRGQPPLHSPVAPRASLPPAPVPQPQAPVQESQPSPLTHARASLPVSQQSSAPGLPSPQGLPNAQNMSQQGPQGNQSYGQYNQYGQAGVQQEQPNQKYEAFAQQAPVSQSPFEGHPSQQAQSQAPPQQPQTAFASAPGEYSPYYASEQQRNSYQSYYGAPYGQQSGGLSQQDGAPGLQQRTASGYNGTQTETASQYPQSSAQQTQSRYATAGEPHTSGHSTPNPVTQAQQQQPGHIAPTQPSQHQPQGQYPYGHPYYSSPYYAAYMNQYQQGYGQAGYGGGPYGGKGGLYNQPHAGYGMSPQTPYDHASSPAAGSFGQSSLHGRDSAVGAGLGEYGRAASGQSSTPQALGGSGSFGMHDTFGRNSSYQGQGQNQHYGQQPNQPSVGDELKPFGDSKAANGPSPSLSQANRPTSAANNGLGQSTLPPPQASQQGYGGYPSHLQQQHALHGSQNSSQYGSLGGHQASAGQGHQGSSYGQYPGFGGSYYGGNNQARGGWGGNYH